ncbi:MAG: SusC/RagA family TonB-linked outer membrane protein [Chitinophagaceae bacterium]
MKKFFLFLATFVCAVMLYAQERTITGTVTDETGAPVQGASVRIKGTRTGVAADNNGMFRIQAKTGDVLLISGGIDPIEVTVGSNDNIAIQGKRQVTTGTEVVVTALGIRKRPKEIGYANTTIKNDQITNGQSPKLGQALSGKAAGLTVYNTSNSVNSAPRIVLRGNRSITGDNTALIVVDGVPVPANTLNYLNPNDVENVTILKGGQAATLYGPDGVNGALVITTKRGGGKPQINFSSTTNFEDVSYLPKFQEEFGSGSGYGNTYQENYRPFENQQYGDRYDGSLRSPGRKLQDGSYQVYPYEFVPGIRKKVWALGVSTTNDVSVSGGDDKVGRFYLSFQDAYIKGVVPKDKYHRDALRFNGSKVYGKVKVGFDGTFAFDKSDRTNSDFYFFALNTPGWIPIDKLTDWQNNPFANPNGYFNDYYNNPWYELDNNRFQTRNNYFNGNINVEFKPVSWLNFTYRLGTALTNTFQKTWRNRFDYTEYAKGNLAVKPTTADPAYNDYSYVWRARNAPITGNVTDAGSFGWRINSDFFATIDKTWGKVNTKLILGNSIQDRKSKSLNVGSSSVIIPDLYNVANRAGELTGGESNSIQRRVGHFADLTVGFNDVVFVHGSVRHDASSLFFSPTRDRKLYNFTYYGGDVSVILTEAFPSIKSDFLSFLKLRASYNKNGNENLGPYSLDPTFSPGSGYPYGSNVGVTVDNTYPDPKLQPEFAYSKEVGFEASFWKDRINVDFSYFTQDVKNQVFNVSISSATGYTSTLLNAGQVLNKGIESELKVKLVRNKNWNIDVSGNYTWNTNEVKRLFGGLSELNLNSSSNANFITATIGQPFPLLKTTYYAIDSASGSTIVNAADGWPTIGQGLKTQGTTIPKHQLGLGLKVAYKWVTLTANAEYRGGNVIYNDLGEDMAFTGSSATTTRYHRQPFVWPNSVYFDGTKYVANTNIAVRNDLAIYYGWGDLGFSRSIIFNGDWFTTSGAFWKIRDISLDFAFPQKWYNKVKALKAVGLSFFGRNLFMWLPKENIYTDPEFSNTNGNGVGINTTLNTPPVRQYGATLRVTF